MTIMSIAKIIKSEFVIPRMGRWKLAYSQHFVKGGFDGIQHSPAQALAMYTLVARHKQRMQMFKELCDGLREARVFPETFGRL